MALWSGHSDLLQATRPRWRSLWPTSGDPAKVKAVVRSLWPTSGDPAKVKAVVRSLWPTSGDPAKVKAVVRSLWPTSGDPAKVKAVVRSLWPTSGDAAKVKAVVRSLWPTSGDSTMVKEVVRSLWPASGYPAKVKVTLTYFRRPGQGEAKVYFMRTNTTSGGDLFLEVMWRMGHEARAEFWLGIQSNAPLKVHNVFPKVTFPPWLHPLRIWCQTVSG